LLLQVTKAKEAASQIMNTLKVSADHDWQSSKVTSSSA